MKVLHICTYDIEGGAARAAYRIHESLLSVGIESWIISRYKFSSSQRVLVNNGLIDRISNILREFYELWSIRKIKLTSGNTFSVANLSNRGLVKYINSSDFDIINLHWVNSNFLSIKDVSRIEKKIVWTLHDMWAFTGGCHYAEDCIKYTNKCGSCFQLNSDKRFDLSSEIQSLKIKSFRKVNAVIAPSKWIENCAKESYVFRNNKIINILYPINLQDFKPHSKKFARCTFSINEEKKVILFPYSPSVSNKRKGFGLLLEAIIMNISSNPSYREQFQFVFIGDTKESFNFDFKCIPKLKDDVSLSLLYSCADVVIIPSIEDNLPNTVIESLACGVPVVGFDIGGMPDLIISKDIGILVNEVSAKSLADAISENNLLSLIKDTSASEIRKYAQQKFSMTNIGKSYELVYKSLSRHVSIEN